MQSDVLLVSACAEDTPDSVYIHLVAEVEVEREIQTIEQRFECQADPDPGPCPAISVCLF